MGGDDGAANPLRIADPPQVASEILDREPLRVYRGATAAMTPKMPVNHPVPLAQARGEIAPGEAVAADAVREHDRRSAFPELLDEHSGAIFGFDEARSVVMHAVETYFLVASSGVSGMSFTEGNLRISGRAIFTQRWTIQESERSNLADSCLMSCSIDSGK
jgi:hypothetical protein